MTIRDLRMLLLVAAVGAGAWTLEVRAAPAAVAQTVSANGQQPDVVRVPARRLNRTEYRHAIRDLLDLDVDVTDLLPADSASFGFDNIAGALTLSPALVDRYVAAATRISALAVGHASAVDTITVTPPADLSQDQPLDGMPLGTQGGVPVAVNFPLDAEYVFKAQLWETNAGGARGLEGQDAPFIFEVSVDGVLVHRAPIGGRQDDALASASAGAGIAAANARLQARTFVTAGPHTVLFTFVRRSGAASQELLQPLRRTSLNPFDGYGAPRLQRVTIAGPFDPRGPGDTPSRRRIFACRDQTPECAREILSTLARRAYRKAPTDADVATLLSFFEKGRTRSFEHGIEAALMRLLSGPEFLFRIERAPDGIAADTPFRVSDGDLASRLSFFLWSAPPDDELLGAALQGVLRDGDTLARQVARMLADQRARTLVTNFAGQWLHLRNLDTAHPNLLAFPDWDDNLRRAFRRETELFVESVFREDRGLLDLLTADYTFVNERLARHYGIPDVYGARFRRVSIPDPARRGLLGHGSILTVTSLTTRTSPVLRGKWILSELLNTPPPPPPPGAANALPDVAAGGPGATMRERTEAHRRNPACASCHRLMDPLGFALEQFDAIGHRRTHDAGAPIDASATLADGTPIDGVDGLRRALVDAPDAFAGAFVEKLLIYALGRGVEPADRAAIQQIVGEAKPHGFRFSSIVIGIVNSAPFQMSRSPKGGQG